MMKVEDIDDDVFFADLNRQISLLITDDHEDGDDMIYYSPPPISCYPPTSVFIQDFSRTSTFPTTQTHYQFDQMNYKNSTTTTTTTASDQSKGTGVFIPKSSQWNRSRRSKHQQQPTKTTNYNSYNNTNNFRHYYHQQQQQLPSQTVFSQVIIGSKKC